MLRLILKIKPGLRQGYDWSSAARWNLPAGAQNYADSVGRRRGDRLED